MAQAKRKSSTKKATMKVRVPGAPHSIFEKLDTFTCALPSTVPCRNSAICCAVNSIRYLF